MDWARTGQADHGVIGIYSRLENEEESHKYDESESVYTPSDHLDAILFALRMPDTNVFAERTKRPEKPKPPKVDKRLSCIGCIGCIN